eukprot:TRINITY_DN1313_c2_g1_i2.p1 TRINITY_DN1313_c2_g1~~TRINITY_DN1313_c2_g1_i2.p1  ORF type:complete len:353 (+),score=85.72 TRINITY_DN1313_c2_g1_i2:68-1060(+)
MGFDDPMASMTAVVETIAPTEVLIQGKYKTILVMRAPMPEDKSDVAPPAERRSLEKKTREKGLEERSGEYKEKKVELAKKEKKSFMDKAQAKLDSVSHKVDKMKTEATQSAHEKVQEKMDKDAEERFKKHFPTLQNNERLVYHDYYCTLINQVDKDKQQHKTIEGYMAVTNKSFIFIGVGSGHDPTFRVDLRDVVCIRRGVKLDTVDISPHCMPLPTPRVVTQGILIYTRQGHFHRLFDFRPSVGTASSNLALKAFGLLDWAWREVNPTIPLPDYPYDTLPIVPSAPPAALMHDVMLKGAAVSENAAAAIAEAKNDPKAAIMSAKEKFGK